MTKMYFVDIGFVEDTVVYELVPKEVGRLEQATVNDIVNYLEDNNIYTIVMDSAHPSIISELKRRLKAGRVLKTIRLRYVKSTKVNRNLR